MTPERQPIEPNLAPDFHERLGSALTEWASFHPRAEDPIMSFIVGGEQKDFTPRQYVEEIKNQTEFGQGRLKWYFAALGDPTGEKLVKNYQASASLFAHEKANPSKPVAIDAVE